MSHASPPSGNTPDDLDGYDGEFDCPGYPEHDYESETEDGQTVYRCRRCGAEYWEDET